MENQLYAILKKYGISAEESSIEQLGNGLINTTWKIITKDNSFVLQRMNDKIFANPFAIDYNMSLLGKFIAEHHPEYFFINPLPSLNGNTMVYEEQTGYFRLFNYVSDSVTIQTVKTPEQAYEAARQFAKFTALLSTFNWHQLKITIPSFHDLSLRYQQFTNAIKNGKEKRVNAQSEFISELQEFSFIANQYEQIKKDTAFKLRVMHHDTKISNVLFDKNNKGMGVIDLDTVMPGYFISDVGDMMRTYLSPVNEEEKDFQKIEIRHIFYQAIVQGYQSAMKDELTPIECKHFFYAGQFMMYMQTIRFLADYLQNDIYYPIQDPEHNLQRAKNQFILLKKLMDNESILKGMQ